MYADDTAISFSSDNIEEINTVVNAELPCFEKWLQSNKLPLNIVETKAMIIGSAQKVGQMSKTSDITPCFQVNGIESDIVREAKYHGVMIDEKLKWSNQAKLLQKKMFQTLGLLKYVKQFVHESTLRNIHLSFIELNQSFCCSLWGAVEAEQFPTTAEHSCKNYHEQLFWFIGCSFVAKIRMAACS